MEKNINPLIYTNSKLINTKKILVFIGLILASFGGLRAHAASLYFFPSSDSYSVGQIFSIGVYVSSTDKAMNAASGVIAFSKDKLEVTSLNKSGSVVGFWVQEPSFSNSDGVVNFEGVIPNPGFIGAGGKIATINFKTKAIGSAALNFSSGLILANDGEGTNILESLGNASFFIGETGEVPSVVPAESARIPSVPKILSPTHANSEKWHSRNDVIFEWNLPSDAVGTSFAFNQKPVSDPGSISDGLITQKEYKGADDGEWYFHLKFRNKFGWGETARKKVLIDATPPKSFSIEVLRENITDPQPQLKFGASDIVSGLDYYEVEIGDAAGIKISSENAEPYLFKMPLQSPGDRRINIKAFDKAGNFSQAEATILIGSINSPLITQIPSELRTNDNLVVRGEAIFNATVRVFIQKEGEEIIKEDVKADVSGKWFYVYEKTVERGIYRIWAQQIDERGAISKPSDKYTVSVVSSALKRFGVLFFDYFALVVTFIVIILCMIISGIYIWHKIRLFKKRLGREIGEAEESAKTAFGALKEEVEMKLKRLEKVGSRRDLTKEEKHIASDLKSALKTAEAYIEKEIKDIERELK